MAESEEVKEVAVSEVKRSSLQIPRVLNRLNELPIVNSLCEKVSDIYGRTRERNVATQLGFGAVEVTVKAFMVTTRFTYSNIPESGLVGKLKEGFEEKVSQVDTMACGGLQFLQNKWPIIKDNTDKIKTTVTDAASGYYNKLQNHAAVKMMVARTEDVLSFSEFIAEATLPTDGTWEEDMKELETADADHAKGALVRAQNLRKMVTRRGKRKLMTYRPVKFSVHTVNNLHDRVTDLAEKSSDAGKKVYSATMYVPNMTLQLSGDVIVSAKELVFALNEAHSVKDMPAAATNVMMKAVQQLSEAKDKLIGHVFVPPQVMIEYLLSSRPIQWIIPHVVAIEDIAKMDVTMEEIEETTESEGNENEKES